MISKAQRDKRLGVLDRRIAVSERKLTRAQATLDRAQSHVDAHTTRLAEARRERDWLAAAPLDEVEPAQVEVDHVEPVEGDDEQQPSGDVPAL